MSGEFELVERCIEFPNGAITLTAIADPDRLLDDDRLLEASHEELPWHPYWVHAGAAAMALAGWLMERDLRERRVLDLGSGLGLTAVAAAQAGAHVLACDHAPPAVEFVRLNTLRYRPRVQVRQFDWRYDTLGEQFDFVVCSDVLYNRDDVPFLEQIWSSNLASGGEILLGDPNRPLTADLLRLLETRGWRASSELVATDDGEARLTRLSRS